MKHLVLHILTLTTHIRLHNTVLLYIYTLTHTYTTVWWRGESADLSQNEISRYQPFKSNFSPDSEFGIFVVNYSTTIYLSTVKRVFIKTVFKYI